MTDEPRQLTDKEKMQVTIQTAYEGALAEIIEATAQSLAMAGFTVKEGLGVIIAGLAQHKFNMINVLVGINLGLEEDRQPKDINAVRLDAVLRGCAHSSMTIARMHYPDAAKAITEAARSQVSDDMVLSFNDKLRKGLN